MLTDIVDRSKRGLRTSNVVLEELEALHTEVDKTYPDELPLLAEISYSIAAIYLDRTTNSTPIPPTTAVPRRCCGPKEASRARVRPAHASVRPRQRLTALAAEAARQLISAHRCDHR